MTTRESWHHATRNQNAHKDDQAAFLRNGGETLFDEEFQLLGALQGRTLLQGPRVIGTGRFPRRRKSPEGCARVPLMFGLVAAGLPPDVSNMRRA